MTGLCIIDFTTKNDTMCISNTRKGFGGIECKSSLSYHIGSYNAYSRVSRHELCADKLLKRNSGWNLIGAISRDNMER